MSGAAELQEHSEVLEYVPAVESGYRQPFDLVAGGGDALHLHSVFCPYEQDFGVESLLERVGDAESREDMAAGATSAYQDSVSVFFHFLCIVGSVVGGGVDGVEVFAEVAGLHVVAVGLAYRLACGISGD